MSFNDKVKDNSRDNFIVRTRRLCLFGSFISVLLTSFMLFIYEPVACFLGNNNEFSFSFSNFMGVIMKNFFGVIIGALIFMVVVFVFCFILEYIFMVKEKNRNRFYMGYLIFGFTFCFLAYIEGNF